MSNDVDWAWKLRVAAERIRTQYEHIGRSTGAPFLAIVYPPESESAVFKEWRTLSQSMGQEMHFLTVDALDATMSVLDDLGSVTILDSIQNPMPGSNPESELGQMWINSIKNKVVSESANNASPKKVIVIEKLAALYPATTPYALMQEFWGSGDFVFEGPVVLLIPGTLKGPRVYSFLNKGDEFMYRGDIL